MAKKSPLQTQAYDYLKEMILNEKLDPDILYSETKMAADIGVSRTPMREAIQCLSQDGYIIVVPSKGFMLRKLSEDDMRECIQIRCAIEGFSVYKLAEEISSKKAQKLLNTMEKLLDKQKKALYSTDGPSKENMINNNYSKDALNKFMDYDHQFHFALIDYAENGEFHKIFQRSMYMIQLTTREALSVPGRTEETFEEHLKIYEYLKNGDGDLAYKIMIKHLMAPLSMDITRY
ncbi:MAG: GntR family transcriptional regulator [Eubacteriales bacterium]|nr:GntR family transcriptional regulator [Eubacteriales bacterium]